MNNWWFIILFLTTLGLKQMLDESKLLEVEEGKLVFDCPNCGTEIEMGSKTVLSHSSSLGRCPYCNEWIDLQDDIEKEDIKDSRIRRRRAFPKQLSSVVLTLIPVLFIILKIGGVL